MQNNKEKEPAPSANDTSSNKNISIDNDTSEKAKCQEHITVPEGLSEDLFKSMIEYVRELVMLCARHGIRDPKIVSRVVYATLKASVDMLFEPEENRHDRH